MFCMRTTMLVPGCIPTHPGRVVGAAASHARAAQRLHQPQIRRWRLKVHCSAANEEADDFKGQSESFVDISAILAEARKESENLVFTDTDDENDVWEHEERLKGPAETGTEVREKPRVVEDAIPNSYLAEQGFKEVDVEVLYHQRAEYRLVLDVRSATEYSGGHVAGAISIPHEELSSKIRAGLLDEFRDQQVAVICASGSRSAQMAVRLTKVFGFENVVSVQGGMFGWMTSGFPMQRQDTALDP